MPKYFIIFTVYFIGVAAIFIIISWILNIPIILSILPGFITIKFSIALSFLLSSLILYFALCSLNQRFPNLSLIIVSFSILVIWMIMITILASIVFQFNSGIENLFITDVHETNKSFTPGQPSLGTIIAFLLITILGLNIFYEGKRKKQVFLLLGLVIFLIGFLAIIGFLFSIPFLYYNYPPVSNPISILASILFILTGLSFILLPRVKINNKL